MARKGSILITVLWVLVLLALFAVSLGFRMHLETRMMSHALERQQLRERTESSVQYARYLIESDEVPDCDYPGDVWYGTHRLSDWVPGDSLQIEVSDEESKININLASPALLKSLFETLAENGIVLETGPEALASSILQWRGESAFFGSPSTYPSKKAPFESIEELLMIEHITPKDLEAIKPYLTVYSAKGDRTPRVNLNTAPDAILEALVKSSPGDEFSKKDFLNALLKYLGEARAGKQFFFRQKDLVPAEILRRINLSSTLQMVSLANQLLQNLTVDSSYFSVEAYDPLSPDPGIRARAVIGPTLGRMNVGLQATYQGPAFFRSDTLEILSWREKP